MKSKLTLAAIFLILTATGISQCQTISQSPSASKTPGQSSTQQTLAASNMMSLADWLTASSRAAAATPSTTAVPATTSTPISPTPTIPTPSVAPTPPNSSTPSGGTGDYDHRWDAVARCEEGGWIGYAGPNYPDSLGINAINWRANGGGSDLSPAAQVAVAQRIEGTSFVPDQQSCAGW